MTLRPSGQRWNVGSATIPSIVEDETHHIPPELFFPDGTAVDVAEHPWLVPDHADENGNVALRVQALVVDIGVGRADHHRRARGHRRGGR
jgi:hypothetical protein